MIRYCRILMIALFAITVLAMGVPRDAAAWFVMTLDDINVGAVGVEEVIIADNKAVGFMTAAGATTHEDADGILGSISYGPAALGGSSVFSITDTLTLSKPLLGNLTSEALIHLHNLSFSSSAAGTIRIMVTDTDFLLTNQSLYNVVLVNDIGGVATGSVSSWGYLDAANVEFGIPGTLATGMLGPLGPGGFSDNTSVVGSPLVAGAKFSLTERVDITHTASGGATSFDKEIIASATPEPGTLLLLGSGLLGMAGYAKLKLKRKKG